jgi:cobalt-zinc-cadmium efflux system protein
MLQPKRMLTLSFVVTIAIAATEVIGGIVSGSISLVSDAEYMFTDVMAIGLSLFCNDNGSKDPFRCNDIWISQS